MDRQILHVDMNGFYASVEMIFHPEARNVPMAVGGDAQARHGVILAKNELAKQRGVKTAETICQKKVSGTAAFAPSSRFVSSVL